MNRLQRRAAEAWVRFWFQPIDAIRLAAFRVVLSFALLLYMMWRWQHATEWLTSAGYHLSPATAFWYAPWTPPLLTVEALPWFGALFFGGIIALILGWNTRWITWVVLGCVVYVTYADRISAFTINKLFIASFTVLAFAPRETIRHFRRWSSGVHPAWPVRVLQLTLVIHYGTAGWCKVMHGDWLQDPYVLWSQVQGIYATNLAAWMLQTLPRWTWSVMQYGALAFEILAPLLFCVRRLRPIGFVWGVGFQMVIALTMHQLIFFSLQLVCFYVLFMDERTLRTVSARLTDLAAGRVSFTRGQA